MKFFWFFDGENSIAELRETSCKAPGSFTEERQGHGLHGLHGFSQKKFHAESQSSQRTPSAVRKTFAEIVYAILEFWVYEFFQQAHHCVTVTHRKGDCNQKHYNPPNGVPRVASTLTVPPLNVMLFEVLVEYNRYL